MTRRRGGGNGPGTTGPAGWWFLVDQFLDRAARVLDSEIARRDDLATVGTTMKIIASVSAGVTSFQLARERPPVADIESAAARVRPLFARDDAVFHENVTGAIGALAQNAPAETLEVVKTVRKAWQEVEGASRWEVASSLSPLPDAERSRTDRQIARDFLYGDLVHADPKARQRLIGISPDERLMAAVVWVADATRLTLATKQLIIDLRDGGYLTPRP